MGSIVRLSEHVSNQIAAGEVVGRPASVVKELMENAVDAGASELAVVVVDAGRTLIQVVDNGKGMSADDAELCFKRHATSKISSPMIPPKIFNFSFSFENLVKILADVIASFDNATAVGPVKRFVRFLHLEFLSANFVILFFVI